MNTIWNILYARQMALHYVCPGICETEFSGSSNPVIILSEPSLTQVTGLVLGGAGGFQLSWNAYPGAICYNVYYLGQGQTVAVLLAQCITDPFFTLPPGLDPGTVFVTAITLEGETPPSDPVLIEGAGSDFWDLSWVINSEDLGTPPGTVDETLEPDYFLTEVTQPLGASIFDQPAFGSYSGSQTYTGPARDCNLHLEVFGDTSNFIVIQHDGMDLVNVSSLAAGIYDFPFTVPLSVAASITVDVDINAVHPLLGPTNAFLEGLLTATPL